MNKSCESCCLAKKKGQKMVYCTLFGINISASHNKCGQYKGAALIEEWEPIIEPETTQRRNDLRTK